MKRVNVAQVAPTTRQLELAERLGVSNIHTLSIAEASSAISAAMAGDRDVNSARRLNLIRSFEETHGSLVGQIVKLHDGHQEVVSSVRCDGFLIFRGRLGAWGPERIAQCLGPAPQEAVLPTPPCLRDKLPPPCGEHKLPRRYCNSCSTRMPDNFDDTGYRCKPCNQVWGKHKSEVRFCVYCGEQYSTADPHTTPVTKTCLRHRSSGAYYSALRSQGLLLQQGSWYQTARGMKAQIVIARIADSGRYYYGRICEPGLVDPSSEVIWDHQGVVVEGNTEDALILNKP